MIPKSEIVQVQELRDDTDMGFTGRIIGMNIYGYQVQIERPDSEPEKIDAPTADIFEAMYLAWKTGKERSIPANIPSHLAAEYEAKFVPQWRERSTAIWVYGNEKTPEMARVEFTPQYFIFPPCFSFSGWNDEKNAGFTGMAMTLEGAQDLAVKALATLNGERQETATHTFTIKNGKMIISPVSS